MLQLWPPGRGCRAAAVSNRVVDDRRRGLQRGQRQAISVKILALSLPPEAWQTITWREGTADWLSSRFPGGECDRPIAIT